MMVHQTSLALAALGAIVSCVSATQANVSPVQKVLMLLEQLEAKVIKDGEAEQKAFDEYVDWCKTGAKDKEYEIKTAKADIESLSATIDKAQADITTFSAKVEDLGSSIATSDADLSAASSIREKENKEFTAAEKELVDAIDTLERAINILARKLKGSALLQAKVSKGNVAELIHTLSAIVDAAALSLHDKQKLLGLVQNTEQSDEDDDALGAPAPEAYRTHSESIVDVLEDLKQKAVAQLEEARREEMNAKHNFQLMKQSIEDQLKVDSKEMSDSKAMMHDATETKATAGGELEITKKDLGDAESVLKSMKGDCMTKAEDHETSLKNREEELKALASAKEAIKEITADASSLVYNTTLLLQVGSGQIQTSDSHLHTQADLANFEVVNLVRKLAREEKSVALSQLAGRISAVIREGATSGSDPFAKVKAMISDMIERLMKDASEEAQHKAYCDKEYSETKQKLAELKYDIEKSTSKMDQAKATAVTLKYDTAELSSEIAETTKLQAEADALRQEEHEIYTQSKMNLEQGLEGVRMALKILRDYYATTGEPAASAAAAAALVQQPAAPGVHSAATGAATGIIGMLEVVESDLGRSLASTEMNEEAAATSYERLKMENKMSNAMKEKDVKYKTKEAASLDKAVTELASDIDSLQTELDAVLQYSTNIRGMCELKPETYEDRKSRREAEIAGLKEAIAILDGEAVLLQRAHRQRGLRRAASGFLLAAHGRS